MSFFRVVCLLVFSCCCCFVVGDLTPQTFDEGCVQSGEVSREWRPRVGVVGSPGSSDATYNTYEFVERTECCFGTDHHPIGIAHNFYFSFTYWRSAQNVQKLNLAVRPAFGAETIGTVTYDLLVNNELPQQETWTMGFEKFALGLSKYVEFEFHFYRLQVLNTNLCACVALEYTAKKIEHVDKKRILSTIHMPCLMFELTAESNNKNYRQRNYTVQIPPR